MHRIDDPTAVPTLPAPRPPGTPGYFTGGSPGSGGFAATVVRYEWMNAVQEELVAVLVAAGLVPDKTNNAQIMQALQRMLRFRLTQDEYLYISPSGNDGHDGLTPGTALATGQAAWNKAMTIDLNNHNLILQFADGTYNQPIILQGTPLGTGTASGIILQGNITTPSNVVFSAPSPYAAINASFGAVFAIKGVTLEALGGPGLLAGSGGLINFSAVEFLECAWAHIVASGSGIVQSNGNPYTIAGGGGGHLVAELGGLVAVQNSALTLVGTPAFTVAFADATSHGMISAFGCAFSGAATGSRYHVDSGGLISTNGGGPNYFPGNAAGFVDGATFGIYG